MCYSVPVCVVYCSCDASVPTTWRGVLESTDAVGLFDSTFTVSCADRNSNVRTAKVARAGQSNCAASSTLIALSLITRSVKNT